MAGQSALSGEPAEASVGKRDLSRKTPQREHGRHQLEGAQASGLLSAELLQVGALTSSV